MPMVPVWYLVVALAIGILLGLIHPRTGDPQREP